MRETGSCKQIGALNHFIPKALPPDNPPLQLTEALMELYGQSSCALGQLTSRGNRRARKKVRSLMSKEQDFMAFF